MKTNLRLWTGSLASLWYPALCPACDRRLPAGDSFICLSCRLSLPETHYHLLPDNPFTERFWGRIPIYAGASFLHFHKHGPVQQLLHQLKYQGKKELGTAIGRLYGPELLESPLFRDVECIIPVPLHPKKQHARGFNQSACFAEGLAEAMNIPWSEQWLVRPVETESQTRKTRIQRLENMQGAFRLAHPDQVAGRHVLLVDDVLTTGATLESCGLCLLQAAGVRLSLATIALAGL